MASEQAKALAEQIVGVYCGDRIIGHEAETVAEIAELIDAAFAPPCPECGAPWKPRAQWKCGSWNEPPARQVSVKCVQRQLAEAKDEINTLSDVCAAAGIREVAIDVDDDQPTEAEVDAHIAELKAAKLKTQPVDPHDGPAVADLADGAPDAMR